MHPNSGRHMQLVGFPDGGGGGGNSYDQPLKFLLVKVKVRHNGFPVKAAKVDVKLVGGRPGVGAKVGLLEKDNPNVPVTVYFYEEEAAGAEKVEISLTEKDAKTPLGKTELNIPSELTLLRDPALYPYSLTKENQEELEAVVWWGEQTDSSFLKAVKAGSIMYPLPNMAYYYLRVIYLINLNPTLLPQNSLYCVTVTVGAQASTTDELFNPLLHPVTATMERLVWFVKVCGESPPASELKVELRVAPADSHRKRCGEYKVVASGVQKLEELYKKKEGVDVGLKKPKSGNGGGEDDEGKKESAVGAVRVVMGDEALDCHVFEEEPDKCSDLRTPAQRRRHWTGPPTEIGYLEVDIERANIFRGMAKLSGGNGTANTYCLLKYGRKWHRTRTVIRSLNPVFREKCFWEVFDTHTVFTVALFDNRQIPDAGAAGGGGQKEKEVGDKYMGRVVIRVSTLFPSLPALRINKFYRSTFPLYLIQSNPPHQDPSNAKLMAFLTLSYRFTLNTSSYMRFLPMLFRSPLPAPNYSSIPPEAEILRLRHSAVALVAADLSRKEQPLGKAVVEDMYGNYELSFSFRRFETHRLRLKEATAGLFGLRNFLREALTLDKLVILRVFFLLFPLFLLTCLPQYIPIVILFGAFVIGLCNYYFCYPKQPPGIHPLLLAVAKEIHPSYIDEEADTTPSSRPPEVIKKRHDALSSLVWTVEKRTGHVATSVVKFRALLRGWDERATRIFVAFCFAAALAWYVTNPLLCGFVFAGVFGLLRLREIKKNIPSPLSCFISRLPTTLPRMG